MENKKSECNKVDYAVGWCYFINTFCSNLLCSNLLCNNLCCCFSKKN